MDDEVLNGVFDVIVLGTGLTECIAASAAAKAGKKVLHIDKNDFYGAETASFSLDQLMEWRLKHAATTITDPDCKPDDKAVDAALQAIAGEGASVETTKHSVNAIPGIEYNPWFQNVHWKDPPPELVANSRSLYVSLCHKLVLCRGRLVDALVRAGMEHYLTFKALDAAYIYLPGAQKAAKGVSHPDPALCKVPCAKRDVFNSKAFKMLEKRALGKFLQFCLDKHTQDTMGEVETRNEQGLGQSRSLTRPQNKATVANFNFVADAPFAEFLRGCKLSPKLQTVIMHAVALLMSPGGKSVAANEGADVTAEEGMACIVRYLKSLGRFGSTAFITAIYGSGEVAQGFSRLCAVNGGIYMLREPVTHMVLSPTESRPLTADPTTEDECKDKDKAQEDVSAVVLANGKVVRARLVVANPEYVPQHSVNTRHRVARATVVATGSLTGDARISAIIPPNTAPFDNPSAVQILQEDEHCQVTPRGTYLWQLYTSATEEDSTGEQAIAVLKRVVASFTSQPAEEEAAPPAAAPEEDVAAPEAVTIEEAGAGDAASGEGGEASGDGDGEGEGEGEEGSAAGAGTGAGAGSETTAAASAAAAAEAGGKPRVVWDMYFVRNGLYSKPKAELPANLIVSAPCLRGNPEDDFLLGSTDHPVRMHHEQEMQLAEHIFHQIMGKDSEFLPSPPAREDQAEKDAEEELAALESAAVEAAIRESLAQAAADSAAPETAAAATEAAATEAATEAAATEAAATETAVSTEAGAGAGTDETAEAATALEGGAVEAEAVTAAEAEVEPSTAEAGEQ